MKHGDLIVLALGAGLLGCTPGIDDYAAEYEEAFCAWQHGCHQYERQRDCVELNALESSPGLEYLRAAVAAGTVEYDRASAAACLDAIRGRACEYTGAEDDEPVACQQAFRGRIGRNGPCRISAECAGDAVCGFDPSCTDMCCEGACRVFAAPLEIGEACGGSVACVPEAYCAFDPSTGAPTVCEALVEPGGDCSFGQPCVADATCDGSKCRQIELRAAGESCEGELVACEEPGVCRDAVDGSGAVCVVAGQIGSRCDQGQGCARFDTYCDEGSKLCTLLPGPGQACALGECLPYAQCETHEAGDGVTQTCTARADEGEACGSREDHYIECLAPLQCVDDVCERPAEEDAPVCPVPGAG